ncbi:Retinoid-inducible serine carboxypeptidase [Chelonia mydas]|uniref:Retinoid-inducible serine carboxypeptidase n=1 Tax=Chelonia mydas TaxID=8469 RepID=M7C6P5_CHEMY|nr:Retinoid-inducible serine carboxypeptidase [Chelonia mydas]
MELLLSQHVIFRLTLGSVKLYQRHVERLHKDSLSDLMNGPIRKKLRIIPDYIRWGGQSEDVFLHMAEDFMKPVIDIVDALLAANVNVTVYNGQLDLIVDTMGKHSFFFFSLKRKMYTGY